MEPSKEAIAVRMTRLNRQILGKVTSGSSRLNKKTIDREALLDALTVLYDECNEDPVKKSDELVRAFVDKYRSTLAELRRTRVCYSDFEVLQTIGRGYFGEVHMVREKETGDVYALKTLKKDEARKRVASAEDERDVLANATGPWIPKLQYAFQDNSNLYLIMELCSGGDLAGLMARRNHPLSERDAAFYVAEIAHALKALHGMGYVHRDVKPQNVFLDRCGHVKLGDFGSCARLSEGGSGAAVGGGTADYVAPELLAAADCARRHSVCLQYCRGIAATAITACDYWSLGVVAFELVTLKRPFSTGDEDSIAEILANIQRYERADEAEPPFEPLPLGPSSEWRSLVRALLRVAPAQRSTYLDTVRHPALATAATLNVRDQAPPWVPCVRGAEDSSCFTISPRASPPPSAAPFRARQPFAGHLPFVGYSYVAPEENEESIGFNASHDCTAIDLATFKSAEKLASMRGREVASLQSKLAAAEAATSAEAERVRREAEAEAERTRARLQAEITALSLQNKRLERQIEVEKEERMALQRSNQELSSGISERNSAEVRAARAQSAELQAENGALQAERRRLEARLAALQDDCARAHSAADTARAQHQHYRDSVAKERAIRRQTLSGGEAESRDLGMKLAAAEAAVARETRARQQCEKRLADLEDEYGRSQAEILTLQAELDTAQKELASAKECSKEKQTIADFSNEHLKDSQQQLARERVRVSSLLAQVKELERGLEESAKRETALEEQCTRTEARLNERLEAAETRTVAAINDEARHREKVNTLEKLVRQLEREVSGLESRGCVSCLSREKEVERDGHSDTESIADGAHAQLALLKEQLERAETQMQARAEEIAALRQEARSANLARWRKEREFNEISGENKSITREVKRLEDRLKFTTEARKTAEQKANALETEMATLKPQYELSKKDVDNLKERLQKLEKIYETAQAEVDRSRNDIRKLKSELQYSEKRRMHAEEQEELSSRERAHLRDELHQVRAQNNDLVQNNKALQEACSLLEEQLTDLEKLADIHEIKNKELENEVHRLRGEYDSCRDRLLSAERLSAERQAAALRAQQHYEEASEQARHAQTQLEILKERLESRESRVSELESLVAELESNKAASEAALSNAARRIRDLSEEASASTTRAHQHHATALQLQAKLADAQEEVCAAREAREAAAAWWRTRETKADATLRQQAKLIDFLQAKVEEATRKKGSLSNKLFGRSGRRAAASPPLRRANRELRDEVDRLRAQLNSRNGEPQDFPPYATPRRERPKNTELIVRSKSIDTPDGIQDDNSVQIVWSDGVRERMRTKLSPDAVWLQDGDRRMRARLRPAAPLAALPRNEADRAIAVEIESPTKSKQAVIICNSVSQREEMMSQLKGAETYSEGKCKAEPAAGAYRPNHLAVLRAKPLTALYTSPEAIALGCTDGLHSLRGPIQMQCDGEVFEGNIWAVAVVHGRALIGGRDLHHAGGAALASAVRRAAALAPVLDTETVALPLDSPPKLFQTITCHVTQGPCVAVACGRRVFLLRYEASATEFKISRSITVDRAPYSLLLTSRALYIAGEKPLRVSLPSGTLETFGIEEPIIAAAARKHSHPKTILLIKENPVEILLCYAECGVFVNEHGRRTRNEDPKWSSAVKSWVFVHPFLYIIGEDKVSILYITDDVYKTPPCTCDTASLTSTASECYMPEIFNIKVDEPVLLGTAPNGIIIRSTNEKGFQVSIIEGLAAFRSVGASVESLETVSDSKSSSTDLAQSFTELCPQDESQESIEASTGFLADIRKRARQLRKKNYNNRTPDDVIKEILTTEVGLKRSSAGGRRSPAEISEFDSDSTDSEDKTDSTKGTNDLCAEMFTRQVRFQ